MKLNARPRKIGAAYARQPPDRSDRAPVAVRIPCTRTRARRGSLQLAPDFRDILHNRRLHRTLKRREAAMAELSRRLTREPAPRRLLPHSLHHQRPLASSCSSSSSAADLAPARRLLTLVRVPATLVLPLLPRLPPVQLLRRLPPVQLLHPGPVSSSCSFSSSLSAPVLPPPLPLSRLPASPAFPLLPHPCLPSAP